MNASPAVGYRSVLGSVFTPGLFADRVVIVTGGCPGLAATPHTGWPAWGQVAAPADAQARHAVRPFAGFHRAVVPKVLA